MNSFGAYILAQALLFGVFACSFVWVLRTASGSIKLKVALALAVGVLVCWSPLATRAILGYPQPRALNELPDRFQLVAVNADDDDQSMDLWIKSPSERAPVAVTVIPDASMRLLLNSAEQLLGRGLPVSISRNASEERRSDKTGVTRGHDASHDGYDPRTEAGDDSGTRWVLELASAKLHKGSEEN